MGTTLLWPEKPSSSSPSPSSQKRVIGELIHGRDLALQLQTLLHRGSRNNGSTSIGEIVGEILQTFTASISSLSSVEFGEVCDDGVSEVSISSKKRSPSKDGRGSYKRRKGAETWITVAPTVEDSYSWRKYGQKEILNAKFPRCYFRCSHKPDQGCRATKQVQKKEDDPKMYHITYIGHHTCKKLLKSPQIIPDSDLWESYSESKTNPLETHFPLSLVKQEVTKDHLNDPSLFGPTMFAEDVMVGCGPESSLANSLEMNDFMIDFADFDGGFGFDESDTATVFSYNNDFL